MFSLTRSWQRGFEAARAAANHSNGKCPGCKLGAALFSGSRLISVGFNVYTKTHPDVKTKHPLKYEINIHAEHAAVIKRRHYDNGKNLTMYVYRENHLNVPVCSKPCVSCQVIMTVAGIKWVRYVDEEGQYSEMRLI